MVSIAEAVSLGIVEPPRDADIVAMEAQSFGVPVGFGGPYCGVSPRKKNLSGRCRGGWWVRPPTKTVSADSVLTLATREQHIRREKATSNICTNQALVALDGEYLHDRLRESRPAELAKQNLAKAAYASAHTGYCVVRCHDRIDRTRTQVSDLRSSRLHIQHCSCMDVLRISELLQLRSRPVEAHL